MHRPGKTGRMETKIGRIVKIDKFAPVGMVVLNGLIGAEYAGRDVNLLWQGTSISVKA